jgi:NADPH:quinone reductase-like Zn-dependent oxidoreductase
MKAMVYTTYGSPDVLKLKEVKKPTPQDDEVLINVHSAAANAGDWHLLRGDPFVNIPQRLKPRGLYLLFRGPDPGATQLAG